MGLEHPLQIMLVILEFKKSYQSSRLCQIQVRHYYTLWNPALKPEILMNSFMFGTWVRAYMGNIKLGEMADSFFLFFPRGIRYVRPLKVFLNG